MPMPHHTLNMRQVSKTHNFTFIIFLAILPMERAQSEYHSNQATLFTKRNILLMTVSSLFLIPTLPLPPFCQMLWFSCLFKDFLHFLLVVVQRWTFNQRSENKKAILILHNEKAKETSTYFRSN